MPPQGQSPLAGVAYRGETSLLRFAPLPADELIDGLVDRFEASSREDRARLRSALTKSDFYKLLAYARRAVVRGLRSGDVRVASRGLVAVAVADYDRVDRRDLAWQAGLLSYAIGRISGDVAGPFQAAAALIEGEGETAALLARMAGEPVASLRQWGFREIRTLDGIGLIEDMGQPYQPAADLLAIAVTVTGAVHGDRWQLNDPVTGTNLPPVWLGAGNPDHVGPAIASITGCVTVRGALPGQEWRQHLLIFVAETGSSQAARTIAEAAGPGSGSSFAAVSAAAGPLCVVMIARSLVEGTPSIETQASLERFRPVLAGALSVR